MQAELSRCDSLREHATEDSLVTMGLWRRMSLRFFIVEVKLYWLNEGQQACS